MQKAISLLEILIVCLFSYYAGVFLCCIVYVWCPSGTGKTSLAVHFAMLTTFDYIRMITASELLALPDAHKIDKIHHAFTVSYKYVVISKMLMLTQ